MNELHQIDEIETKVLSATLNVGMFPTPSPRPVADLNRGKLDPVFNLYSGLPCAAEVPAAVGLPLSIHSKPTAIMAPTIGPAM